MNDYQIWTLVITGLGVLVSIATALLTYRNLREIRKQFFEQHRGNLIFYIDKAPNQNFHTLVLRNYGNAPAKLIALSISPDIDWEKSKCAIPQKFNISNAKNIFLVPHQFFSSDFDFEDYPDKLFKIEIIYQTCGKTITENYSIDLSYTDCIIEERPTLNNSLDALKAINNSIQRLSERFF